MSERRVLKTNIRVVVHPRREGHYGWATIGGVGTPESHERHEMEEAERIHAQIKRHVDDFEQVSIAYDYATYCRDGLTVDREGRGLDQWPNCCSADQQEFYDGHASEDDDWFFAHGMEDPDYLDEFRASKDAPRV
jgi:hypothetical protein